MTIPPTNLLTDLLDQFAPIDPTAPSDARMAWDKVPAKMAVYLLTDASSTPLLLATVGNLRAALQRRLADTPSDHKSKRLQYGQLCTTLRYRLVHSPFAANWYYYQTAKLLFPDTYHDLVSWRNTHFIGINPNEPFPRFRRFEKLDDPHHTYLGPISDRRAADQLIQTLEDLFDLCRYYHILVQAPHGKACAYKEMGKCPAPCDGSISMPQYRTQITAAFDYLSSPSDALNPRVGYHRWRSSIEAAMRQAASQLQFEAAAKLKQKLTRASLIEQESYQHMDLLSRWSFIALQPGQGKPWIQPFFIHGGLITPGTPVKRKDLPQAAQSWFLRCQQLAAQPVTVPISDAHMETMAILAHHLFRGPDDAGLYLPTSYITSPDVIANAATELLDRRTPPKPLTEQSTEKEEATSVAVSDSISPLPPNDEVRN